MATSRTWRMAPQAGLRSKSRVPRGAMCCPLNRPDRSPIILPTPTIPHAATRSATTIGSSEKPIFPSKTFRLLAERRLETSAPRPSGERPAVVGRSLCSPVSRVHRSLSCGSAWWLSEIGWVGLTVRGRSPPPTSRPWSSAPATACGSRHSSRMPADAPRRETRRRPFPRFANRLPARLCPRDLCG